MLPASIPACVRGNVIVLGDVAGDVVLLFMCVPPHYILLAHVAPGSQYLISLLTLLAHMQINPLFEHTDEDTLFDTSFWLIKL